MLPLRDRLPTSRTPYVNYALIALNVLAFVGQRALIEVGYGEGRLTFDWGLVPARVVVAPLAEALHVLTSMFMHDASGWLHLGGNMLFLWIFGDNVEDAIGSRRYVAFYLLCGVGAAAAQVLVDPTSVVPMVGASGAISGVLAAYGSLYPMARVTVLNPIPLLWLIYGVLWEFPAFLVILEYFVMNLFQGVLSIGRQTGGVAFFAHLGGFVAGMLLVRVFVLGRRAPDAGPPGGGRSYVHWSALRDPERARGASKGAARGRGGRSPPGPFGW